MNSKIAKRIRKAVKKNGEQLITKKEYMKLESPTKNQKKGYTNWVALYKEAKRVYRNMSQNQKTVAWR